MVKSDQQIWGLQYVKCCCLKALKSSYQTHTEDKATLYDVPTTASRGKKMLLYTVVTGVLWGSQAYQRYFCVYFQFIFLQG